MQQPTLAPAPHPNLQSASAQEAATTAEQTILALRAHLLPHISSPQQGQANTPPDSKQTGSASPDLNIDPAISGVGAHSQQASSQPQHSPPVGAPQSPSLTNLALQGMSPGAQQAAMEQHSGAEETQAEGSAGKGRGGKRELSTSKRAAQNRAAQRAFRQRKEGYIKKLEEQVRDFNQMQDSYKQIQAENYQLRDYIINLQSRLIEHQGEEAVPPPPLPLINAAPPSPAPVDHSQQMMPAVAPPLPPASLQAPTANMGIPQSSSTLAPPPPPPPPPAAAAPTAPTAELGNGSKRAHEETNAFLQSVATAGNGFLAQQQQQAKRLKNDETVNGN